MRQQCHQTGERQDKEPSQEERATEQPDKAVGAAAKDGAGGGNL